MVRVRFAPSPTGNLHVGNARTAIINYLFSRKEKGTFLLRMEDTDLSRSSKEFEDSIVKDLSWLGIGWDEDLIRQSERFGIYREYADVLLHEGFAYKCFCSKERLIRVNEEKIRRKEPPGYDGYCRRLTEDEIRRLEEMNSKYVLRFMVKGREVAFDDMVFGHLKFSLRNLSDFIIIKADGTPSYNFSCVVDDMLMGITHVIRGRDHIPNTPKQILIFQAFGKEHPVYGHHPLLLEKDGKPLSKREGSRSIGGLRSEGVLPQAVFNYLAVLGRRVKKEVMDIDELIESFSLDSISKSDASFDYEKVLWFSRQHIRKMDTDRLAQISGIKEEEKKFLEVIKENASTTKELLELIKIFEEPTISNEGLEFLKSVDEAKEIGNVLFQILLDGEKLSLGSIKKRFIERSILLKKEVMLALRVLVTGRNYGPPIEDLLPRIPREVIMERVRWFLKIS